MKLTILPVYVKYSLVSLLVLGCICSFSPPSNAQSTYGTISGLITDPSGGAIADVQVTLTNQGTGEKRTQTTGSDGLYQFVNLFAGRYRVDAEKAGFKRTSHPDVVVEIQQTSRIDLTMQLGQITESVEVTAETPLLQPETSSLGQVIEQRQANELPLNGRNVFNLALLSPSVVPQGSTLGSTVGKNPFDTGNYQMGGAFANQGVQYLDGEPLNIGYINLPLVVPTQDTIGEFKVQYSNLGPEWGKFAGGVINFTTKSGTNTWHGELYEYLRARVLNGNNPFNKAAELEAGQPNKAPPYTQNQFGGTAGGRLIRDKLFVFGSYEGYRQRAGSVFTTTVPTAQERTGNFGDLCTNAGGTFNAAGVCSVPTAQLYNPLTVNPATGARNPIPFNNLSTGNNPVTLNGSPAPWINPTAAYLMGKLIGNPTGAGTINPVTGEAVDNFTKSASTGGDIDEYVVRGDYNLTASQHLFGRFTYWKQLSLSQDPYGTGLCKDRCTENTRSKSAAVGWTDAITSTLTASINLSASRFHYLRGPVNANFDVTKEGWPAQYNTVVPNLERTPMTPCFYTSDFSGTAEIGCSQGQSAIDDLDTLWNLSPQFTKIHGRHTFAFGMQLEQIFDNYLQTNTGGGFIGFSGSWTGPVAKGAVLGNDYADFLLGFGLGPGQQFGNQSTGSAIISAPIAGKQTYTGFYFGDTWKVTNKLTLNLGLRWELAGPWTERFDRLTYFDPKATNATVKGCSGTAGSACAGDLFLVKTGTDGNRYNLPYRKDLFSPRLGLAYSLNPKTVIRTGFGMFFIPSLVNFGTNPYIDPTASATTSFFNTNNSGLTPSASLNMNTCTLSGTGGPTNTFACTGQGPFGTNGAAALNSPAGRNPAGGASFFGLQQTPLQVAGYTTYKAAYMEQWNLDIQRELPGGWFADVAYAGAHGVHLQNFNTQTDQIPDSYIAQAAQQCAASPACTSSVGANPVGVTIAQPVGAANYPFSINLPGSLGPASLIQGQLNRPFPEYTGLSITGYPCCGSRYSSLQATLTKRFKAGGTLLIAYTNSKLISNTDTLTSWLEGAYNGGVGSWQDNNNPKGEYSLVSQDVSQRLVFNYVLDLPFGHGKRFASDATGVKDKFIAGWGVDGVTVLQRGFPLKITDNLSNGLGALGLLGTSVLRPDVVSGCDKTGPRTVGEWFNTACFTNPAAFTFGNESRTDSTLRQDGVINFDFAIFKRTYFGPENKYDIEFRTEFFNLFNRNQWAAPGTSLGTAQFGIVSAIANQPRLIQFGLKFAF